MQAIREMACVTSEAAAEMCAAAVAHAESIGVKINVAVVDAGGNLLAFRRMDGAFLHSVEIAQDKAYAAVSFGMPTGAWHGVFKELPELRDGLVMRPRFVTLAGGVPLMNGEQMIGGVGVSGASEQQDEACAEAAIAILGLDGDA